MKYSFILVPKACDGTVSPRLETQFWANVLENALQQSWGSYKGTKLHKEDKIKAVFFFRVGMETITSLELYKLGFFAGFGG